MPSKFRGPWVVMLPPPGEVWSRKWMHNGTRRAALTSTSIKSLIKRCIVLGKFDDHKKALKFRDAYNAF
ncbi:hypothetical protein LCGC14_0232460 [marine sediment metagenome]|uniref:Uncharacterized protein n=1 Tax=marine sediment metagenome TaxID=412755 RepID=A0A0F9UAA9_9ZZZZ